MSCGVLQSRRHIFSSRYQLVTAEALCAALRRIGRDDVVRELSRTRDAAEIGTAALTHISGPAATTVTASASPTNIAPVHIEQRYIQMDEVDENFLELFKDCKKRGCQEVEHSVTLCMKFFAL